MLESWAVGHLFRLCEWDEAMARWEALGDLTWPLVEPFVQRGELEEARLQLELARGLFGSPEPQQRAGLRATEAFILATNGKMLEALATAEEALALRAELGLTDESVQRALEQALNAAFALGDRAKVDELLGIVEELPPGGLTPYLRAIGARFGARRAALDGDEATASAAFLAAADIFREIEMPFDLAVVQLEHVEWLAANGHAAETEPLLNEARTVFERLRAAPWLERLGRVDLAEAEPVAVD